jgi:hypothetical protein
MRKRSRWLLGRRHAGQRPAAEVEEGLVDAGFGQALEQLGVLGLDELGVLLQPDHVFGEDGKDRCLDARGRVPLEGVDIVLGEQFARALLGEIPG